MAGGGLWSNVASREVHVIVIIKLQSLSWWRSGEENGYDGQEMRIWVCCLEEIG